MQNILQIENPSSDEELSKAAIHKAEMSLVAYTKVSSFPCCKFHWKLLMRYLQRKMRHWGLPHIS